MKNTIFYLDDMPDFFMPIDGYDHNLIFIYSLIHKTIFNMKQNQFVSDVVDDLSLNGQLKLKFKNNKYGIEAKDVYATLIYIIEHNSLYASYLSFIVGVKAFLRGNAPLSRVQLCYQDNVLEAKIYDDYEYKYVLSSIHFAPLKFQKKQPLFGKGFGQYVLVQYNADQLTLVNKINGNKIYFLKERDVTKQLAALNQSRCLIYTGCTSLSQKMIIDKKATKIKSNMEMRLNISSEIMMQYPQIKPLLSQWINKYIKLYPLVNVKSCKQQKIIVKKINFQEITILYACYYPNNIIIEQIKAFFEAYDVKVKVVSCNFKNFLRADKEKYDLVFDIVEPITLSKFDFYLQEMNYLVRQKKQYITTLNRWIQSNHDVKYETKLQELLNEYSSSLCIGRYNMFYLKSDNAPYLQVDDYGQLLNLGG